ncbi:hypothetical protein [Hymenobacter sp. HDW8]|uniref:hypothetical protein n=1 Tax=Hymenobacter sp. HDW8 TaxID=2714932 RepID=UPI00140BA58A|nr:hypothetical protein [Hymenobacter sp. HDW8]QIL75622.1 hypothetical protein G7064_06995 [Hymenobacter sp. HDW8]
MPRLAFTQPADFLKERDFGQKIEASFDFVRAHFRPFGKCMLYIVLPAALLTGIGTGLMQSRLQLYMQQVKTAARTGNASMAPLVDFIGSPEYVLAILGSLLTFMLLILTTYGYMTLTLSKADSAADIEVADVWALVRRRFFGTLLATLGLAVVMIAATLPILGVFGLLSVLGSMAGLLLPVAYIATFYVMVSLSLFHIIWVREELGFFATLRRCFYLVWGKWWSTFGLIMVMLLIIGMMAIVFFIPQSFLNITSIITPDAASPNALLVVAVNTMSSMALMMLYPLLFLAIAFQYFNLVERKEGEGLHRLVGRIGQPAVVDQPVAAARYRAEEEGEY